MSMNIENHLRDSELRYIHMSVIQGVGESDDDFLARLREEARYFDLKKLKTAVNPEEELVKMKFISGLRDPEAKL